MIEQKYIDRFFSYVSPEALSGCWIWTGSLTKLGYGQFNVNGKPLKSHRISAEIHGLDMSYPVVKHFCNNPSCVNPAHLSTGTQQENMQDMINANRQSRGISVHFAKLTEQQVLEIRAKYIPRKYTEKQLAIEYNVSQPTIHAILTRQTWAHI